MKEIEAYLEELYRDVRNSEEAAELMSEMRSHLQQAVEQLMAEGLSEEESVRVALERFGDQGQLVSEMDGILQVQRTFAKNVLRTAVAFLLVGFVALVAMNWLRLDLEKKWESQALQLVGNEAALPTDGQKKLAEMVMESSLLHEVEVYAIDPVTHGVEKPVYSYQKSEPGLIIWPILPGYAGKAVTNDHWMVSYSGRDLVGTAAAVFCLCVIVYWVLFAVWGTVNAYQREGFHWAWVVVFALFNVVGYLLYWGEQKRWRLLASKFA